MPRRYPLVFHVSTGPDRYGRPVAQVAADLGISAQVIHNWRVSAWLCCGHVRVRHAGRPRGRR